MLNGVSANVELMERRTLVDLKSVQFSTARKGRLVTRMNETSSVNLCFPGHYYNNNNKIHRYGLLGLKQSINQS